MLKSYTELLASDGDSVSLPELESHLRANFSIDELFSIYSAAFERIGILEKAIETCILAEADTQTNLSELANTGRESLNNLERELQLYSTKEGLERARIEFSGAIKSISEALQANIIEGDKSGFDELEKVRETFAQNVETLQERLQNVTKEILSKVNDNEKSSSKGFSEIKSNISDIKDEYKDILSLIKELQDRKPEKISEPINKKELKNNINEIVNKLLEKHDKKWNKKIGLYAIPGGQRNALTTSLASGNILVGNTSNIATPVAMSGVINIDSNGVTTYSSTPVTSIQSNDGSINFDPTFGDVTGNVNTAHEFPWTAPHHWTNTYIDITSPSLIAEYGGVNLLYNSDQDLATPIRFADSGHKAWADIKSPKSYAGGSGLEYSVIMPEDAPPADGGFWFVNEGTGISAFTRIYTDGSTIFGSGKPTDPLYASVAPTPPGGSSTQVQFNNSGTFGGISGVVSNGVRINIAPGSLRLDGATSGYVDLRAPAVAPAGVTFLPSTNTTLIGTDTTDTLTNKTYDTAGTGNFLKINGTTVSSITGSGATVVLKTQPTFNTDITVPQIYGASTASAILTLTSTSHATKGKVYVGNTLFVDELNNRVGINNNGPTAYGLEVVATIPAGVGGTLRGGYYNIASAGSTAGVKRGLDVLLGAGYTGVSQTVAMQFGNNAAGTGSNNFFDGNYVGNIGVNGFTSATTSGTNIGVMAYARGGNLNIGSMGAADDVKSNATNVGIGGFAYPPGGTGKQVGVAAVLSSDYTHAITFASCALFVDNGNVAVPIQLWRDAGAVVATMDDGGKLFVGGTTTPTAFIHAAASTTSAASFRIAAGTAPTSPNEGDMWADSTQKAIAMYADGMTQYGPGVIFTQTADQTVTNTVTETTILGTGVGTKTLPANFFVAGKTIRLRVGGIYSTPLTGASATIKVKYGSTVIASVTTTSLLSNAANLEFDGEVLITCRTTGSSGTVMAHGDIEYATGITGTIAVDPLNNAGAATTINTTTSNALDVSLTWDGASSTRSAKSTICTIEVLN